MSVFPSSEDPLSVQRRVEAVCKEFEKVSAVVVLRASRRKRDCS